MGSVHGLGVDEPDVVRSDVPAEDTDVAKLSAATGDRCGDAAHSRPGEDVEHAIARICQRFDERDNRREWDFGQVGMRVVDRVASLHSNLDRQLARNLRWHPY